MGLFLSGFQYKFEYINGKNNGDADGLSRLPSQESNEEAEEEDYFHFVTAENMPVDAAKIKKKTRKDNILSKVYMYTKDGWPNSVSKELQPFASRATEINIENNVLMWGYRIIIPDKCKRALLEEIHGTNLGMSKMKAISRQYFWWPQLDRNIECFVNECEACKTTASRPEKATLVKFPEAKFPFDRVHIDFAGPFKGKVYLIIVDAFSKWTEIYEMHNTSAESTIDKLRDCFARFGLPCTIISDNGKQFVSEEFINFCRNNSINHNRSAPYHPATNGLAENAVGSFKKGIMKTLAENRRPVATTTLISRYLATYRNAPHSSTGESPSKIMFGREIRTRLSLLSNSERELARERQMRYFKGSREISFLTGELVYVRDYKNPMKSAWKRAVIKGK